MVFAGHDRDVVLRQTALAKMRYHYRKSDTKEAGGILLGKVCPGRVSIEDATTPNASDRSGRFFFIRSKVPAQEEIDRKWRASDGRVIYLGEWHTHAEARPQPTGQDRQMIESCLRTTVMEIDFLLLLILGKEDSIWLGIQTIAGLMEFRRNDLVKTGGRE